MLLYFPTCTITALQYLLFLMDLSIFSPVMLPPSTYKGSSDNWPDDFLPSSLLSIAHARVIFSKPFFLITKGK